MADEQEKRVLLLEYDFERLIKGEIVHKNGVKIALADIGFEKMRVIIAGEEIKDFLKTI